MHVSPCPTQYTFLRKMLEGTASYCLDLCFCCLSPSTLIKAVSAIILPLGEEHKNVDVVVIQKMVSSGPSTFIILSIPVGAIPMYTSITPLTPCAELIASIL